MRFILLFCVLLTGCASQLPDNPKVNTYALPAASNGQLSQFISPQTTHDGIYPLGNGFEAFLSRLALITTASQSIDLQYYIYRDDDTTSQLNHALLAAAKRGVRIRLLLDDLKAPINDTKIKVLAEHRNIEIRLFNPATNQHNKLISMLGDMSRLNSRMHNKSMTVDSLVSIVGGRNIGDEYFSASRDVDFGDYDLMAFGPIVKAVNQQFDLYWNHPLSYPYHTLHSNRLSASQQQKYIQRWQQDIETSKNNKLDYIQAVKNAPLTRHLQQHNIPWVYGKSQLVFDHPDKILKKSHKTLIEQLNQYFTSLNHELIIISPYFVPQQNGLTFLSELSKRGIKVTVITNSLAATDVVAVHSGYAPYREALLKAGITLYEVKVNPDLKPNTWQGSSKASLHAKAMIFDDHSSFVGSFNFDPRSAYINTEMGIVFSNDQYTLHTKTAIYDSIKTSAYQVTMEQDQVVWIDLANKVTLTSEPDASIWRKITVWFMQWLPIEDQL